MEEQLAKLKAALAEIADLNAASSLLSWDQETYMPPGGAEARSEQLATLSKIAHEKFITDEIGLLLEGLTSQAQHLDYDSDEAAIIRMTARDYEKARKLPASLVAELSRATSLATEAWKKARANNDFAAFQPHLEKVVDLTVQKAEAWGYNEHIYDALLDYFEPDMKSSQVAVIFKQVKLATIPLLNAIVEHSDTVDNSVMHLYYNPQQQWDFGVEVIRDYGFNFAHGRQDKSAHPFTISFSTKDVRLTTRILDNYLPTALFGTMHEAGHGMYEQGFAGSLKRTGLDDGVSLGIHESQSRMWENIIGRSKAFWSYYYPRLQEFFPEQLGSVDLETFYRAINAVKPSLIRVEADEVTYNLHIFVRFEIERELVSGIIKVADLPEIWNEKMKSYLGIVPNNDTNGVLQDIHWSSGLIGYFPTYALGNIISVQFFNQMLKDDPTIIDQIVAGKFDRILSWLRTNIHVHGRKYTPTELIKRVSGSPLNAQPYIDYITAKYTDIYGL
jgi:carboxypeptidase Taq